MAEKPKQPQAEPIRLTTACVIDAQYFAAGETLPFVSESEVPPNLRHLIADAADDIPPVVRDNVYGEQGPEPGPVFFQQTGGSGQWRQARKVAGGMQEQLYAEAEAEAANAISPEVEEALQDQHDRASALGRAEIQARRDAVDAAYARAEADVREREERQQLFVRRGGAWGKVQNCQLKPGEPCFVRRENGQYEASGFIDATGTPPDSENLNL